MLKRAALAWLAVIPLLIFAGAALGQDVEDITVTEGQTVTKNYSAILANEPPISPIFGTTARVPDRCRSSAYCDAIDLKIETPASYQGEDFFRIDITLSWQSPAPNDLNMYLHRPDGYRTHTSATANNPEKISVPDPRRKEHVIIVSNFSGTNSGYVLSVAFVPLGRASFPEPTGEPPSSRRAGAGSSGSAFPDLPVVSQPDSGLAAAGAGQRSVERPGEDGPASRNVLLTLPAARDVPRNSSLPFIVTSVLATFAAVGLGVSLYYRGRRESES